jgi:hypothetical protein
VSRAAVFPSGPALLLESEFELEAELRRAEAEAEGELEYLLSPTRLFTCSPADRAAIAASGVVGRPVSEAQLRGALRSAITQATTEARATARALRTRPRAAETTRVFRSVFNVPPTFVPQWRTARSSWRDLGDLVALRLERAAGNLDSGYTRYFCLGCSASARACTTPHAPVAADRHRLWIGRQWWRWWRDSQRGSTAQRRRLRGWMASTLLHEALHIHFILSHHTVTVGRPSVNNMYCYDTLVSRFHRRTPKPQDEVRCRTGWRPPAHP